MNHYKDRPSFQNLDPGSDLDFEHNLSCSKSMKSELQIKLISQEVSHFILSNMFMAHSGGAPQH